MDKAFEKLGSEEPEVLRAPLEVVSSDVQADFTNNQWYCHQARQTVFFTAFTNEVTDLAKLKKIAARLAVLAPQLTTGFIGACPFEPLEDNILSRICQIDPVDDLAAYPESWELAGGDIFAQGDLPLFRVKAVTLRNGADPQGRRAAIVVLATHALLEGADSSLLSRSRSVPRGAVTARPDKTPLLHRLRYGATAAVLVPLQLLAAYLLAPRTVEIGYRALAIEKERIRRAAAALNVSRRTLMFALVAHGLNDGGGGFSRRGIKAIYADMDAVSEARTNDTFFQFRMIDAKLGVREDFAEFVEEVDQVLTSAEHKDMNATQSLLNAMFSMHRRLSGLMPFLYTKRFYRFTAGYHLTLSLVPPQRLGGELTKDLMEPVYCGTRHPGINMCVFSPGRTFITFNFCLHRSLLPNVDKISALLDEIDPPSAKKASAG